MALKGPKIGSFLANLVEFRDSKCSFSGWSSVSTKPFTVNKLVRFIDFLIYHSYTLYNIKSNYNFYAK